MGELESEGKQLGGLVGGIAEHDTLVTSAKVLQAVIKVETLGNIGGLLLNSNEEVKSLVVETLRGVVIANVLDGIADNFLVVDLGFGRDLTKDHDHAGLSRRLASDLGERVLSQAGVEDSIRDLIGNLIGVPLTDRLRLISRS